MWLEGSMKYITEEQSKTGYNRVYTVDCVNDMIQRANDEGCLVSYNHPVWSLQNYSDYIDLKGLWGVELYNTGCARNGYFELSISKVSRVLSIVGFSAGSHCQLSSSARMPSVEGIIAVTNSSVIQG